MSFALLGGPTLELTRDTLKYLFLQLETRVEMKLDVLKVLPDHGRVHHESLMARSAIHLFGAIDIAPDMSYKNFQDQEAPCAAVRAVRPLLGIRKWRRLRRPASTPEPCTTTTCLGNAISAIYIFDLEEIPAMKILLHLRKDRD